MIYISIRVWLRSCLPRHSLGVVAHNVEFRLVQMLVPSLLTIELNNYYKKQKTLLSMNLRHYLYFLLYSYWFVNICCFYLSSCGFALKSQTKNSALKFFQMNTPCFEQKLHLILKW